MPPPGFALNAPSEPPKQMPAQRGSKASNAPLESAKRGPQTKKLARRLTAEAQSQRKGGGAGESGMERQSANDAASGDGKGADGADSNAGGGAGGAGEKSTGADSSSDEWRSKYSNLVITPADRGQSSAAASSEQSDGHMSLSSLSILETRSALPVV